MVEEVGESIPVEVRVCSRFLVAGYIRRFPTEKEIQTFIHDFGENRRVDNIVPHWG